MKISETPIPGLLVVEPDLFEDTRGYFFESWHITRYKSLGIEANFVQDNESKSLQGVVRGLHYQVGSWAQSKLVRVIEGKVFDVAVDIRLNSPTFGQWFGIELDGISKKQLFIPKGFAHGFSVISSSAIFSYKCDNYFNQKAERAININDPQLAIDWKLNDIAPVISEKDKSAPLFKYADIS